MGRRQEDLVGLLQRLLEGVLHDLTGGGVAARLEAGDETMLRVAGAQGFKRQVERRRMMAEILDHRQVGAVDQHLLTTLDALERIERVELELGRILGVEQKSGGDGGHGGVTGIEETRQGPLHPAPLLTLPQERERRARGRFLEVGDDGVVAGAGAHADDRSPGDILHQTEDIGVIAIGDDRTVARDDADDVGERAQDVIEVAEDVGVVELAVIDREHVRQILDELATLVEEGRVVFVAFDDEGAAWLAGMRGIREIARDAADEPARLGAVGLEQHCGHAGRRGLAVGTGDDDVTSFVQQAGPEQLRERDIRLVADFEQPLHFGVSAGSDVTDHDQVRLQLGETFGGPAFQDVDARATQVVGHRRIDARIGPHDLMTQGAHQQGGVTHRRAADAHEINAHGADKSPRGPEGEKLRRPGIRLNRRTPATLRRPGSGTLSDCASLAFVVCYLTDCPLPSLSDWLSVCFHRLLAYLTSTLTD